MKYYYIPKLKHYRSKAGLKLAELADLANLSQQTLRRVEKGNRCAPTTAFKLLSALNEYYYDKSSEGSLDERTILKTDPNDPGPR